MQQRQVRDLMRIRHGHVVPESATLREIAERLIVSDCDVMAITDSLGRLTGIVCESSVVRALMSNPADSATVQSIVSRHAESVRLDACLNSVLPLFRSSANTAIPVIDEAGRVCGLLMRRDVIGCLLHRRVDAAEDVTSAAKPEVAHSRPMFAKPAQAASTESSASAESQKSESTIGQKPTFLRGAEARSVLWAAEDRL